MALISIIMERNLIFGFLDIWIGWSPLMQHELHTEKYAQLDFVTTQNKETKQFCNPLKIISLLSAMRSVFS